MPTLDLQETRTPSSLSTSSEKASRLEREASQFRASGKVEKAFASYDEAASLYRDLGEHLKAAVCFAAAATCWDIHTGWLPLQKSANRNHMAAVAALKARNYDYARTLFRNAALLYEKEGDYENYSECFIASQRAGRERSWEIAMKGQRDKFLDFAGTPVNFAMRCGHFFSAVFSRVGDVVWGYGEKPFRTLGILAVVVIGSTFCYAASDQVLAGGVQRDISFLEAFYFSMVTFATVGYGDYLPLGGMRIIAILESLANVILVPLFFVALTRRYLRMYR